VKFKDKVKLPKKLPFKVEKQFEEVVNLATNSKIDDKMYKRHFVNLSSNSSIVISSTDAKVVPSDEGIENIKMDNGETIQYFDNGELQFVYFNKDGLFYELVAKKDFKNKKIKYDIAELMDIVQSM
jgi:hypothetical protein